MPKRIFKKLAPDPDKIKNHASLRFINHLLHTDNIWYFNRRSVPKAFAIGVFCAFLPLPCQMLLAAVFAILFQANISLAIILVWITNPVTMGPIFYFAYKIGCYVLDTPGFILSHEWSLNQIYSDFILIWKPLWLGSMMLGIIFSILSYYAIKILWYVIIVNKLKYRSNV